MAGTGTVEFVGAYIETKDVSMLDSFVGAYVEVKSNLLTVPFVGVYIEESWDATPIIVSTDGEQSPIFGVFN